MHDVSLHHHPPPLPPGGGMGPMGSIGGTLRRGGGGGAGGLMSSGRRDSDDVSDAFLSPEAFRATQAVEFIAEHLRNEDEYVQVRTITNGRCLFHSAVSQGQLGPLTLSKRLLANPAARS